MADTTLSGLRVLDLSRWIAGPLCGMILGDAGADVIKLEKLGGEDSRSVPPEVSGMSAYTAQYNRNKRSIAVDFRSEQGLVLIQRLAASSDLIIQNFRPGVMAAMGVDYDRLAGVAPGVIMTSISGFGQRSSLSHLPGFNAIAEAFTGAMDQTGDPAGPPTMSGYFVADHATGLYAAIASLIALQRREQTGQGQHIDIALADSMFSVLGYSATAALNGEPIPRRSGNRDSATAPADLFVTGDGKTIYIDAGTDALFRGFCAAVGMNEAADDPRFASNDGRLKHLQELHELLDREIKEHSFDNLAALLTAAGIPHSPVNTVIEAANHPYFEERGMVEEVGLGGGESIRIPGSPMKLSRDRVQLAHPPPRAGQHTAEILREICGLEAVEIEPLLRSGVVR